MAGNVGAPTPWWQTGTPAQAGAASNLDSSAPAGYTYDRTQMRYVPIVGSAPDALTQRSREQGIQDIGNEQEQANFANQQKLFGALSGIAGSGSGSGSSTGAGATGGGAASVGGGTYGGGSSAGRVITPQGSGVGTPSITLPQWPTTPSSGGATSIPSIQALTGASDAQAAAAESASHATVQDNAAKTAQGAMRGLTDSLAARGLSGAGYEAGQIGNTLSREANTVGEGDRQYAQQMYNDAQHRADVNTQAAVTGRGQDIGAATASRGQDLGAYEAQVSGALSKYGIDTGARTTERGQDIGAQEANLAADTSRYGADTSAGVATRGQDVNATTAANALAQQKQLALASMLQSALGGIKSPGLSY